MLPHCSSCIHAKPLWIVAIGIRFVVMADVTLSPLVWCVPSIECSTSSMSWVTFEASYQVGKPQWLCSHATWRVTWIHQSICHWLCRSVKLINRVYNEIRVTSVIYFDILLERRVKKLWDHVERKYWGTDNTNIGKERENSYWKNEEIAGWKAHKNTWKLNWNISTITDGLSRSEESKCMWTHGKVGTTLTICSHTFTLFWSRKTYVIVETFQLSFFVCLCMPFVQRSLRFFAKNFLFPFLLLVKSYE